MQASNLPSKIPLPFANAGTKNTIPTDSQVGVTPGAASLQDGFPPLTFTPLASGGVPPAGADFNGILHMITAVQQWQCAGGAFKFDAAFASSIGGYPAGAVLESTSNDICWLNLSDNNSTDPDAIDGTAANWVSLASYGIAAVTGLTNTNVTLTPAQSGKPIITLAGALTGNVQIIFPAALQRWMVVNNTTGGFAITCKTASGAGVGIPQGTSLPVWGDGTNLNAETLYGLTPPQFDNTTKAATTEFLARAGVQFSDKTRYYSDTAAQLVLTAADIGAKISFNGGANQTCKLPATTGLPIGASVYLSRGGSTANYLVTVSSDDGTNKIDPQTGSTVASINLQGGEHALFTWSGAAWIATGTHSFREAQFGSSLSNSGYQKLPSGLIVQWGSRTTSGANSGEVFTFPIAFPSAVYSVTATVNLTSAAAVSVGVTTLTGVPLYNEATASGIGVYVIAIGK